MKKEIQTKINLGIEILRFILCFWIITIHCSKIKQSHAKYLSKGFHVPTFILISFFFYFPIIRGKIINKIISRFQRLLIPYLIWPFIVLIINNIALSVYIYGDMLKHITIKDIFTQILIGCKIHAIFWFQFNLIFLSLFFTIFAFIFNNHLLKVIIFSGIISFFLHISTLNYIFFIKYKKYFGTNMGSIIELFPMAAMGSIISSKYDDFKKKYISIFLYFILASIIFILFQYNIFLYQPGLRYSNVSLNIFASTNLFLFFSSLSFEKIKNEKYILLIRNFTNFTGGIYYIHHIIRDYLRKYTIFFKKRSYSSALIIYVICYFVCFIGSKSFKNYKLKYLFL